MWKPFNFVAKTTFENTHQAHQFKKIDENKGFFDPNFKSVPNVRKSFLGCADRKTLLIYPFPPQNIRILSIAPLEQTV